MDFIGKKILETRKIRGLTQEELAEKSNMNLRTIQRIENNESEPRGKTLNSICEVLQLDVSELLENGKLQSRTDVRVKLIEGVFLVVLNLIFSSIFGYLMAAMGANFNSRLGAFLLSFFIPIFIVRLTQKMTGLARMLKFGTGFIVYMAMILILDIPRGLETGLLPCLVISLSVLYFGKKSIDVWN